MKTALAGFTCIMFGVSWIWLSCDGMMITQHCELSLLLLIGINYFSAKTNLLYKSFHLFYGDLMLNCNTCYTWFRGLCLFTTFLCYLDEHIITWRAAVCPCAGWGEGHERLESIGTWSCTFTCHHWYPPCSHSPHSLLISLSWSLSLPNTSPYHVYHHPPVSSHRNDIHLSVTRCVYVTPTSHLCWSRYPFTHIPTTCRIHNTILSLVSITILSYTIVSYTIEYTTISCTNYILYRYHYTDSTTSWYNSWVDTTCMLMTGGKTGWESMTMVWMEHVA